MEEEEENALGAFFKVKIDGIDEVAFREVSGLTMTLETQPVKEGGQNRFVHQLPLRTSSEKLVLKRALMPSSAITAWCKKALEEFSFEPRDIEVSLMNPSARTEPLVTWQLIHAYPVKWSAASFDASKDNELVIESVELQYRSFTKVFPF